MRGGSKYESEDNAPDYVERIRGVSTRENIDVWKEVCCLSTLEGATPLTTLRGC